jgi:hypothetical protein
MDFGAFACLEYYVFYVVETHDLLSPVEVVGEVVMLAVSSTCAAYDAFE